MKELSLHILDIAKNSVRAGASLIELTLTEQNGFLEITVTDNGCGMDKETLEKLSNPFFTTRTTRSVGLGVPLLRMAAEQTGGTLEIESSRDEHRHGTRLSASFDTTHIDCAPLGDIISTVLVLIQGNDGIDFCFTHKTERFCVELDTRTLREVLGDVPLSSFEVLEWIRGNLEDQYSGK